MLNEDVESIGVLGTPYWRKLRDEVPHLPFEAHVGNEALVRGRVDARQVAGVWVAIGISVGDIEEDQNVVTTADDGAKHDWRSLLLKGVIVFAHSRRAGGREAPDFLRNGERPGADAARLAKFQSRYDCDSN